MGRSFSQAPRAFKRPSFRQAASPFRWPRHWPVILVLTACFGPYLAFGLRTEQVVVYALALPAAFQLARRRLPATVMWAGTAWLALVAVAAVVGLFTPDPYGRYVAGVDNLLLPLAAGVIAVDWAHRWSIRPLLLTIARWYTALLAVNAAVILTSFTVELGWLRYFWTTDATPESVAAMAATMGRMSGVFNQPIESGVAYSLGLVLLAYWTHHGRPGRLAPLWALLLVGGVASVSKVFLLVGLPIGALYLLYLQRARLTRVVPATAAGAVGLWVLLSGRAEWAGVERVRQLFTRMEGRGAVETYSAGRYGQGGSLRRVVDVVLDESPLLGFGAQGLPVSYDSAYVEGLVVAGLVGLVCYLAALLALMLRLTQVRAGLPERALTVAVLSIIAAAGLGGPTFTGNRVGVPLILVVVGLLVGKLPAQREIVELQPMDV